MAYSVYVRNPTWADGPGGGTSIDAADLNANDVGVFNSFYSPAVKVTHNANQSITHNTNQALAFNTELYDQAGNAADTMHDTVTNNSRLTCRYAGVYAISGCVQFAANATGLRYLRIQKNGANYLAQQAMAFTPGGVDATIMSIYTEAALVVNDYVEFVVFQTSGAGLNVNNVADYSPTFQMSRVA